MPYQEKRKQDVVQNVCSRLYESTRWKSFGGKGAGQREEAGFTKVTENAACFCRAEKAAPLGIWEFCTPACFTEGPMLSRDRTHSTNTKQQWPTRGRSGHHQTKVANSNSALEYTNNGENADMVNQGDYANIPIPLVFAPVMVRKHNFMAGKL